MKVKVYNFYKEGDEVCEANTKLLHRVVGFTVEDIIPEDRIDLVDLYEICMTPTAVFIDEETGIVKKLRGKITIEDLDKLFS